MEKQIRKIDLKDIGYHEFFDINQKNHNLIPARVIAQHKELYILRNETSELSAKITGKMMFSASSPEDYPTVGDWVLITVLDKQQALINEILPRKTVLARKAVNSSEKQLIAANIDVALIVQSPDRDYNLNKFERYIVLVESEKIKPVIVLNKTDLLSEDELTTKINELTTRFEDIEIYTANIINEHGINDLRNLIKKGLTYCFLGSSGVGKSSIINVLLGEDLIKTGEISSYAHRGKHITTHRELYILKSGGILIDNPGMREIGVLDSDAGIRNVFSEIYELSKQCKYSNCSHVNEPGCEVRKAVSSGKLSKDKYKSYLKLVKENQYNTMSKQERRKKDREFGKFIKNAKKQIKKYKS